MTNENVRIPHDPMAEETILGAILCESKDAASIFESLEPNDFFNSITRSIFDLTSKMHAEGEDVNLVMVGAKLADNQILAESCGGVAYVAKLGDGIPTLNGAIPMLCRRLRSLKLNRALMRCGQGLIDQASIPNADSGKLADLSLEILVKIADQSVHDSSVSNERDAAASMLRMMEQSKDARRVETGIPKLDKTTGGFLAGELVIMTAETGVGKTFLALQAKRKACSHGLHGLFVSGEMLAEHLMGRNLASRTQIPYAKFRRTEFLSDDDWKALTVAASEQCQVCRILDSETSLANIRMSARAMAARKELAWLIVDYDELIDVSGAKDEWQEQKVLVRSLKSLAMQLRIPVILVSQLRKALSGEDRSKPTLASIYGTGGKTKHASMVIYIDRPFVQELEGDLTKATLWLLKCRDGVQGTVQCVFNVKSLEFCEVSDDFWDNKVDVKSKQAGA